MITRIFFLLSLSGTLSLAAPPQLEKRYDLVVYGATPGGVACAVRAAREGLSVLVVSPWHHVGGLFANGISTMDTLYNGSRSPIYDEFRKSIHDYYREKYGAESEQYQRSLPGRPKTKFESFVAEHLLVSMLERENRITVVKSYRPLTVTRADRLIASATYQEMNGPGAFSVAASAFADCSYEGDFFVAAKVPYRLGRESREEFNEEHAGRLFMIRAKWPPEGDSPLFANYRSLNIAQYDRFFSIIRPESTGAGDKNVQAYNLRTVMTRDPENRIPIEMPAGYDRNALAKRIGVDIHWSNGAPTVIMPNKKSYLNLPQIVGSQSAYPDGDWATRRKITEEHAKTTLSLIYFMQNDQSVSEPLRTAWKEWGLPRDEFADNGHLPYEIYIREGRRIKGREAFTENDALVAPGLKRAPIAQDSISITEWFLDSHACTGEKVKGGMYDGTMALNVISVPAQIPYGTMLPEEIDNLLVPVCASTTHVGWGVIRLEPTWMSMAEAAAYAIALAKQTKTTPAAVDRDALVRKLADARVLISFFNDIEVNPEEPWLPAVEYFGTQGFFGSYEADPLDPLRAGLAKAWAAAAAEWLAGKQVNPDDRARQMLAAEQEGGDPMMVKEFLKILADTCAQAGLNPPIDQALNKAQLARDLRMNRGAALRLIYALKNPNEKGATPEPAPASDND